MKVLIVDDNHDILEILEMIMEDDGHSTKTIDNGDDLAPSIETFQPDVILLDVMLGNHDGRLLCAGLKGNEETKHIPIVIISASHLPESFLDKG